MGFIDNIISSIARQISYILGGAVRKKITPNSWDLINPDAEFKKVIYEKVGDAWTIHYNNRPTGDFNSSELKVILAKTKTLAYNTIAYKLEAMNPVFKNRKLNDLVTKEFMKKLGRWNE